MDREKIQFKLFAAHENTKHLGLHTVTDNQLMCYEDCSKTKQQPEMHPFSVIQYIYIVNTILIPCLHTCSMMSFMHAYIVQKFSEVKSHRERVKI